MNINDMTSQQKLTAPFTSLHEIGDKKIMEEGTDYERSWELVDIWIPTPGYSSKRFRIVWKNPTYRDEKPEFKTITMGPDGEMF